MLWWLQLDALRLNVKDNLVAFWSDHGRDLIELTIAIAIAFLCYILVTPESYAPNNREENRKVRRENRHVKKAVLAVQALYRGNRARGRYAGQKEAAEKIKSGKAEQADE